MVRHDNSSPEEVGILGLFRESDVLLQCAAWLTAWLVLPAWLAIRGHGVGAFLICALISGMLLSIGDFWDRDAHTDAQPFACYMAVSCLAVLLTGGIVFSAASLL
jgi:hypothetical protein